MRDWLFCIDHFLKMLVFDTMVQRSIESGINNNWIIVTKKQQKHLNKSFSLTSYLSTKSKNKSVEYGCEVKTRVLPQAEVNNARTPENQYNELKHNPVNGRSKIPGENT